MSEEEFSVKCNNCSKQVSGFCQKVSFTLTSTGAVQGGELIILSCGCQVDFPVWGLDTIEGFVRISDGIMGTQFIEFMDEEVISEEYEGEED